ncbi:MFS monocarboxylate [Apiospora arundinis]
MAPPPTEGGEIITPDSPPPDGGHGAWLVVLGAMVSAVHTWGIVNSFGVFQTYYERELFMAADHHLEVSSSAISWIGSLQGALLMMGGVVSGPLFDMGHLRLLLVTSHELVFLGMLLYLSCAAAVGQWFEKRRALAMGMYKLQPRLGFGWATRIIALVLLVLCAIPLVFVKTRIGDSGGPRHKQRRAFFDTTFFRDAPMLVFTAAIICAFLGLWLPFFYAQLYSIRFEVSSVQFSPYFVTLLNVGSALGRIIPPWIAVYAGALNTMLCMMALCAMLGFLWMGITNFTGLVVFAVLYGLFQRGLVSMLPGSIVPLTPDMSRLGTRMGTSYMFLGLSVLAGTPIAGAILGRGGDLAWKGLIAYSGATLAGGSVLLILALVLHRRERHE